MVNSVIPNDRREAEGSAAGFPSLVFQPPQLSAPSPLKNRRKKRDKATTKPESIETVSPEPIEAPVSSPGPSRTQGAKRSRSRSPLPTRSMLRQTEVLPRRKVNSRLMLVRETAQNVQIGVLEDKVLVEHYVARASVTSMVGNVYLGRVQNVFPGMEAAFVDVGQTRNAVLYSGEVGLVGKGKAKKIEQALKPGDTVLAQVTKDPVGHKGARLTTQISLAGRYLVHIPGVHGISRKLSVNERSRLKKAIKSVVGDASSLVVRTAAEGATESQLQLDAKDLIERHEQIMAKAASSSAPALIYSEPELLIRLVRDIFNEDFDQLVIEGAKTFSQVKKYLGQVAPEMLDRLVEHRGKNLFDKHRVTEQVEKALSRKVFLPSGGSLVIDHTEAMTVIDVNTGKFVGTGGNLEQTVTENNLEAVEEIVRQIRLRDLGGIVVIDFIDMLLPENQDLVYRRLLEALGADRTRHQLAEITSLGLVQMTRKRQGLGLRSFSESCSRCDGSGFVVDVKAVTGRGRTRKKVAREINDGASAVAAKIASGIAAAKDLPVPSASEPESSSDGFQENKPPLSKPKDLPVEADRVDFAPDGKDFESARPDSTRPDPTRLSSAQPDSQSPVLRRSRRRVRANVSTDTSQPRE